MAIDPATTTTVKVGELASAGFNASDLVPHEVGGLLKKGTLGDLATFIGGQISATSGVGFRAVQVLDGQTLPATTEQEFILVGPGTFPNVGGGASITTTEELNALVSNGTYWFIGVEIPINAAEGAYEPAIATGTTAQYWRGDKSWQDLNKAAVGLGNVDNTTDAGKPISTATQTALDLKANDNAVVKLTGDQTISGTKTFDASLKVEADLHIKQDSGIGSITGYSTIGANSLGLQINNGSGRQATLVLANNSNRTYTFPDANGTFALTSNLSSYLPLTGGTIESSGSTNTLNINHSSGSGVAASITKGGNGEALTVVKSSGTGNAASITGGVTLLSELNLTTKLADAHINSAATWNAKIGGSGTTNYLPKFTGTSSLGNSLIYDNGTNVGIGTTNPLTKFSVSTTGNNIGISIGDSGNPSGKNLDLGYLQTADYGYIQAIHNGVAFKNIALNPNGGNVGIGTTSPTQKLDVNGLINSTNGISVGGSGVSVVWTGTQAAYDAITTKSNTTIYFIQ
jgi:hypothetical protein